MKGPLGAVKILHFNTYTTHLCPDTPHKLAVGAVLAVFGVEKDCHFVGPLPQSLIIFVGNLLWLQRGVILASVGVSRCFFCDLKHHFFKLPKSKNDFPSACFHGLCPFKISFFLLRDVPWGPLLHLGIGRRAPGNVTPRGMFVRAWRSTPWGRRYVPLTTAIPNLQHRIAHVRPWTDDGSLGAQIKPFSAQNQHSRTV